jgi:signal transduction histidine kinase
MGENALCMAVNPGCLTSKKPQDWTWANVEEITYMAKRSTKLGAGQLARMVEISRVLNSATNLGQLLTYIIKEAAELTDTEAASILLLDPRTRQLHFVASSNEITSQMAGTPVPIDGSIAGAVLQANKPMYIPDVSADPRWNQNVDEAVDFQTSEILGVPLRNVERQPIGVLEAINKQSGNFSRQDVETLAVLADLAGVAIEKARLFEQLGQANKELSELDQLKTDFIAIASHELRTPLSVILGYVSFLREGADTEMASQLDNVLNAATHLRNLIQDMLNLQYVDAGQTAMNLSRVDLVEVVRELAIDKDETAAAKQQIITIDLPPTVLKVLADRDMLEVVLGNLLSNAIKFTPDGGQIDIHIEQHGDEVWCCVHDEGIGISEEDLKRIFKRFYQVESPLSRRYEGMGLGLAIARDLVELNQGRLWAESQGIDKGSSFYVALPLYPES